MSPVGAEPPSQAPSIQRIRCLVLHPGTGSGELLVLDEPLSFWGGVSAAGEVIDRHHPQHGASLTGRVVAMPAGRGSSSSSSVLAEQIRAGTAPAALILADPDSILVVGAVVAAELYGIRLPVVQLRIADFARLPRCAAAWVRTVDGTTVLDLVPRGSTSAGEDQLPGFAPDLPG
jgi:predicted aconitase with swiveling domain